MAHFAELDENNVVQRVIVISNEDIFDEDGDENEEIGIELCKKITDSPDSIWKQTSYNSRFRNTYASIGSLYLEDLDCFTPAQPYSSWNLNRENLQWDPPVPYPENYSEFTHYWDEENLSWEIYTI